MILKFESRDNLNICASGLSLSPWETTSSWLLLLLILFEWRAWAGRVVWKRNSCPHPRPAGDEKSGHLASDGPACVSPCSAALDRGELSLVSQAESALQHLREEQARVSDVGPSDPVPAARSLSGLALPLLRLALDDGPELRRELRWHGKCGCHWWK